MNQPHIEYISVGILRALSMDIAVLYDYITWFSRTNTYVPYFNYFLTSRKEGFEIRCWCP